MYVITLDEHEINQIMTAVALQNPIIQKISQQIARQQKPPADNASQGVERIFAGASPNGAASPFPPKPE
jgi:hypothetical protein